MSEHHLNNVKKVIYICEMYRDKRFYYRQEYLTKLGRWGEPKPISEDTFLKRQDDGYPVVYKKIDKLPAFILEQLKDLDSLIDLALDTRDKDWFDELVSKRKEIF
ncbi:IDEAL domain-containing protein [Ammoniphilus sp. YIM 78166]|uniref:IDEAL domain-containing protein n=1 Tax=Ammoniphilus sp. YIM 78166 TaxID=1644106 RepID=UPI00106F20CF|nr:IDEAL domain-containing protein [Ammoniphilus sp. YIM 78166]